MALNQQRIEDNLERFKEYYVEEYSKTGKMMKNPRRHLFWVEHLDSNDAAGQPVLGHQVEGMIRDDKYKFEYLGLNGSTEAKAKLQAKLDGQQKQIEEGLSRKQGRTGYVPEAEAVESEADKAKAEAKALAKAEAKAKAEAAAAEAKAKAEAEAAQSKAEADKKAAEAPKA